MAFECPHCGFRNNELQSAGVFNERGHTITLTIKSKEVSFDIYIYMATCIVLYIDTHGE